MEINTKSLLKYSLVLEYLTSGSKISDDVKVQREPRRETVLAETRRP
jgi:hypothetical protein